mmetsp:Transcript_14924/g.21354  ORF Transcript_14924/g.21354 Transcript_14924/m.21354 type:complete len:218 (+) Transcript_14924:1938-2591(+)
MLHTLCLWLKYFPKCIIRKITHALSIIITTTTPLQFCFLLFISFGADGFINLSCNADLFLYTARPFFLHSSFNLATVICITTSLGTVDSNSGAGFSFIFIPLEANSFNISLSSTTMASPTPFPPMKCDRCRQGSIQSIVPPHIPVLMLYPPTGRQIYHYHTHHQISSNNSSIAAVPTPLDSQQCYYVMPVVFLCLLILVLMFGTLFLAMAPLDHHFQ